jgi:uncharacterized protein (DUF2147 family)
MKKSLLSLFIAMILNSVFFISAYAISVDKTSANGFWTTISDEDNKPRSVVQIISRNGQLEGIILKVYAKPDDHELCIQCHGKLKNQPIIGLRILWDLIPSGDRSWASGKILDPKTGKVYKCKISLDKTGKKLSVRGYIGISLFGRTQTWIRHQQS